MSERGDNILLIAATQLRGPILGGNGNTILIRAIENSFCNILDSLTQLEWEKHLDSCSDSKRERKVAAAKKRTGCAAF